MILDDGSVFGPSFHPAFRTEQEGKFKTHLTESEAEEDVGVDAVLSGPDPTEVDPESEVVVDADDRRNC